MIDAGIGARIRHHHQAVLNQQSDAVGHFRQSHICEPLLFRALSAQENQIRWLSGTGSGWKPDDSYDHDRQGGDSILKKTSVIAAALMGSLIAFSGPAAAQSAGGNLPGGATSLQETHGDWQVACFQRDGGKHCQMAQRTGQSQDQAADPGDRSEDRRQGNGPSGFW